MHSKFRVTWTMCGGKRVVGVFRFPGVLTSLATPKNYFKGKGFWIDIEDAVKKVHSEKRQLIHESIGVYTFYGTRVISLKRSDIGHNGMTL